MKKLFSTALLLSAAACLWAQTDVIKVSTSVDSPEAMFTITNGNGLIMTSYTSPTETGENAGKFAFYSVTNGNATDYKIYSMDRKKWVSYTPAASYDNKKNFALLVDKQSDAKAWRAAKQNVDGNDYYEFSPLLSSGSAATNRYMNWFQGKDGNPLDNTNITVGLWQQGAKADKGSRWIVKEVVTYTYTLVTEGAFVTINGKTIGKGETITVMGSLSPSQVIPQKKEGKFATVYIDSKAMTISVTYHNMPVLRDSKPYTQAWVYPKQQDAVGKAQCVVETDVYTLFNDVLAASFIRTDKAIYFLGSKAMNLLPGSELFVVGFGAGDKVAASQMELKNFKTVELPARPDAVGGAEHFAGKALEATFGYTYKGQAIEILWRAVLRDGSHYLRTEMELKGIGNVDMYDIVAMTYNVDSREAGSKPKALGNTRGKVIMNDRIFAGLETPTAYNTVGGASNDEDAWNLVATPVKDNLTPSSWQTVPDKDVPMRVKEVGGANRTYFAYKKDVQLKKGQRVLVTIKYQRGNNRLDLDGADLLDMNGSVVASDYHHGFTGNAADANSFAFIVPNDGTFSVRAFCDNREGNITADSEFKVDVFEAKPGVVVDSDIVNIQGLWSRNVTLKAGEIWKVGAVVGLIAQDGKQSESDIRKTQKRRSFLAYSERERAVPWRAYPCYISWYELNINRNNAAPGQEHTNMQADKVLNVLAQWKTQMFDKYGVGPAAFIIDDGWDNYGTWTFHSAFPNQMKDIAAKAAEMNAGCGAWLGPVGGYGQSGNYRRNYWSGKGGMQLSNPEYYKTFLTAAENLVKNQHKDGKGEYCFFKFDGISAQFSALGPDKGDTGNENAEGIIRLEQYVRENLKEDIFFNTTVGTWASPFWYQITDATWRQENDHGEVGNNSNNRENWITYRDNLVHQNYVTNSPICPINTLMTHGFILTKFGPPAGNSRDYKTVLNELRCAFACGSGMVELYNDYDLMNSINNGKLWADLAELIKWQKDNADVLMDAHWVGGDPWTGSTTEVYGWASWNGEKATLALRNGGNNAKIFTTTLREALEIPANINGKVVLKKAFVNQVKLLGMAEDRAIDIDTVLNLKMPASSVYVFNGKFQSTSVSVDDIAADGLENNQNGNASQVYDLSGRKVTEAHANGVLVSKGKKVIR